MTLNTVRFIHRLNNGCGEPAFSIDRSAMNVDEPVHAADVTLPDGTHPRREGQILCGTCGDPIFLTTPRLMIPDGDEGDV